MTVHVIKLLSFICMRLSILDAANVLLLLKRSLSMSKILIIEDEQEIADTMQYAIVSEGMQALWVANGADAKQSLKDNDISLCILDIGLPDCSGFELLKEIRQSSDFDSDIPVLMLTARNEEIDRIVGLEIGADDYVAKPFSPREVVARVKAILKRSKKSDATGSNGLSDPIGFSHDQNSHRINYNNSPLDLTKAEYSLLQTFLEQPRRVFSRRQLIDKVWSSNHPSDDRAIDTHIKTLRAKLRTQDPHTDFIITHRGFGYSLEP